jgi:lysophospholipase L1-like esterase
MKKLNTFKSFGTLLIFLLLFSLSGIAQKSKAPIVNKYENDIVEFEKLDRTEKYPDNSLLFVGSSSIRLWSTLKEDVAPYPVIQRGFGGSRSPDVLFYLKRIVYPHQIGGVVIFVANDITGAPNDLTTKESMRNYREMVKIIRAKYKKQPIFFIELTPTSSRWKYWPLIQQTNNQLRILCKKQKNLYFIETAQSYLNEKGEPRDELFKEDHLHQNRDGYRIWGKLVKEEIGKRIKVKG